LAANSVVIPESARRPPTTISFSFNIRQERAQAMSDQAFRKYECIVCGYIYDEAEGAPDDGIPPGTRWEDVPEDWLCPDCGVGKEDFEPI
jgi:rubredoxin